MWRCGRPNVRAGSPIICQSIGFLFKKRDVNVLATSGCLIRQLRFSSFSELHLHSELKVLETVMRSSSHMHIKQPNAIKLSPFRISPLLSHPLHFQLAAARELRHRRWRYAQACTSAPPLSSCPSSAVRRLKSFRCFSVLFSTVSSVFLPGIATLKSFSML